MRYGKRYGRRGKVTGFRKRISRRRIPGRLRARKSARLNSSPSKCGYRL